MTNTNRSVYKYRLPTNKTHGNGVPSAARTSHSGSDKIAARQQRRQRPRISNMTVFVDTSTFEMFTYFKAFQPMAWMTSSLFRQTSVYMRRHRHAQQHKPFVQFRSGIRVYVRRHVVATESFGRTEFGNGSAVERSTTQQRRIRTEKRILNFIRPSILGSYKLSFFLCLSHAGRAKDWKKQKLQNEQMAIDCCSGSSLCAYVVWQNMLAHQLKCAIVSSSFLSFFSTPFLPYSCSVSFGARCTLELSKRCCERNCNSSFALRRRIKVSEQRTEKHLREVANHVKCHSLFAYSLCIGSSVRLCVCVCSFV